MRVALAKWHPVGKDCSVITGLIKPIISRIEKTRVPFDSRYDHTGVVDLLLLDGASNVQKAVAQLVSVTHPTSLWCLWCQACCFPFFKDVFTKVLVFKSLSLFSKWGRNIFDQLSMVLMPSSRRQSIHWCTTTIYTLGLLRLVNATWPENWLVFCATEGYSIPRFMGKNFWAREYCSSKQWVLEPSLHNMSLSLFTHVNSLISISKNPSSR